MSFPTSPTNNQTALVNGIVYQWNETLGVWKRNGSVDSISVGQVSIFTQNGITFADGSKQTTARFDIDQTARNTANGAYSLSNTNSGQIEAISDFSMSSYTKANSAFVFAGEAFNKANSAAVLAQQSFDKANAVNTYAASSYSLANTSLQQSGGTITGSLSVSENLTVTGNLIILGNSTSITTETLNIGDSLIYLAANNYSTDAVDIGLIANYNDGTNSHTGIFRDPNLKEWFFFQGYTPEVESNNLINIEHASFALANVKGNYFKGNLITNGVDIYDQTIAVFESSNAVSLVANYAADKANNALANTTGILDGDLTITGTVSGGSIRTTTSAYTPENPVVGDMWYDSDTDALLRYTFDGASNIWMDISGPIIRTT